MEGYLNVFNNKVTDLIQISIKERSEKKTGILFLNFSNKEKLDVYYIPLIDKDSGEIHKDFPPSLVTSFIEKSKNVPPSVIFFYLFDENDGMFLEFDLEKDSEYTNYKLKETNKEI